MRVSGVGRIGDAANIGRSDTHPGSTSNPLLTALSGHSPGGGAGAGHEDVGVWAEEYTGSGFVNMLSIVLLSTVMV